MKKIRLGVIGCGGIAQMVYFPYLKDLDDRFELTAFCDIDRPLVEDLAKHYDVNIAVTDFHELLSQEIDAVLILSWGSHFPQIMAALDAGKHVFVEKPLCYNTIEAEQIAQKVRTTGLKIMVGYMKRYDPAYIYARNLIQQIEDLRFIDVTVLHPVDAMYREHHRRRIGMGVMDSGLVELPQPGMEEAFFAKLTGEGEDAERITAAIGNTTENNRIGYFFMIASLIHDMNAIRGIMGNPSDVISTEIWHSGLCIHSVLRFGEDVRCSMKWIYLPYQKNYFEELAFYGSSTRIRIQFPSPYLLHTPTPVIIQKSMEGHGLSEEKVIVSYEEEFRTELIKFYEYLECGEPPETTIDDAYQDLYWLQQMAIKAAIKDGEKNAYPIKV
jgi:predicted dehydrogenase